MSVINLGRTTKTNIVFYQTDGMGRDGYITYNNGGFWKNKQIKLKNVINQRNKMTLFRSLFHQPAPFTYISDGSGRDSYVIEHNGGLVKKFEPMIEQKLPKFLRKNEDEKLIKHKLFLTKSQRKYLYKIKKIQDSVVYRLYNNSLEKIKKNNLKYRNNSLNDLFFNKEKFYSLNGTNTPYNGLTKSRSISLNQMRQIEKQNIENQNNKSVNDNFSPKKNIFENIMKNDTFKKDNSCQTFGLNNNNHNINNNPTNNPRRIKVLKKIKINSPYFNILNSPINLKNNMKKDDLAKQNKNNLFKYFQNLSPNYQIRKINKRQIYQNNNFGYSSLKNSANIKINFNDLRNSSDNIQIQNWSMNDTNKNKEDKYKY